MVWNSASDFFHMGGYGLYVWGSVIVTFVLVFGEILILQARRRAVFDQLRSSWDNDADNAVESELSDQRNEGSV